MGKQGAHGRSSERLQFRTRFLSESEQAYRDECKQWDDDSGLYWATKQLSIPSALQSRLVWRATQPGHIGKHRSHHCAYNGKPLFRPHVGIFEPAIRERGDEP